MADVLLVQANALQIPLKDKSVHACITSPPYYNLRRYDCEGQLGLEASVDEYVANLVQVFREVKRVLRDDGTSWLVIADSYNAAGRAGHGTRIGYKQGTNRASASGQDACRPTVPGLKPKDLCGVPWALAFALRADGWTLRSDVIWAKSNCMPESVTDRVTKSHEYIFMFSKQERYFFDAQAIAEPLAQANAQRTTAHYNTASRYGLDNGGNTGLDGLAARMRSGEHATRNARSVWTIPSSPFAGGHFACFPQALAERCIKAATSLWGCCSMCGSAWKRVVERTVDGSRHVSPKNANPNRNDGQPESTSWKSSRLHSQYFDYRHETTGWQPSCTCDAGISPAIVLDPFAGASTTGLAARALGRRAVCCDLSLTYLRDLSRERLGLTDLTLL